MKLLLLSVLAVAMIGLMVPSAFADDGSVDRVVRCVTADDGNGNRVCVDKQEESLKKISSLSIHPAGSLYSDGCDLIDISDWDIKSPNKQSIIGASYHFDLSQKAISDLVLNQVNINEDIKSEFEQAINMHNRALEKHTKYPDNHNFQQEFKKAERMYDKAERMYYESSSNVVVPSEQENRLGLKIDCRHSSVIEKEQYRKEIELKIKNGSIGSGYSAPSSTNRIVIIKDAGSPYSQNEPIRVEINPSSVKPLSQMESVKNLVKPQEMQQTKQKTCFLFWCW